MLKRITLHITYYHVGTNLYVNTKVNIYITLYTFKKYLYSCKALDDVLVA